ncbi:MAG: DUF2829 domain-containing protein [Saprospiraceae bacterium]|nr:DUF2829 domain-containing protein [Saprospiraceae bacterium]
MTFSEAIQFLQKNKKVCRQIWPVNTFLMLYSPFTINPFLWGQKKLYLSVNGVLMPYVATGEDVSATDWKEFV